jgi:hypothetical protein
MTREKVTPESAAARLRALNERENAQLVHRRTEAQALGKRLAEQVLSVSPETSYVLGFGSTFETWRSYRTSSDVDLAVDKGSSVALERLAEAQPIKVDILSLEECRPDIADFVRAHGIELARRQPTVSDR